jgi:hypothetical protein
MDTWVGVFQLLHHLIKSARKQPTQYMILYLDLCEIVRYYLLEDIAGLLN